MSYRQCISALFTAAAWGAAAVVLLPRNHYTFAYEVAVGPAVSPVLLGTVGVIALVLGVGAARAAFRGANRTSLCWLSSAILIPLLEVARRCGIVGGATFLEPLLFAGITGASVLTMTGTVVDPQGDDRADPARLFWRGRIIALLLTLAMFGWLYYQGTNAYAHYLLGYSDFGPFSRILANTWEGRGFMQETPFIAASGLHFNPGLVLLTPLWGLWPSAHLIISLQAACLVFPAVCIYEIARACNACWLGALAWAAAYLAYPAMSQLNLNFSYGWHPVTCALPLIFGVLWALSRRRYFPALCLAIVACSFKETVFVFFACLSSALCLVAWMNRGRLDRDRKDPISRAFTPVQWLAVVLGFVAAGVTVSLFFSRAAGFQTSRLFGELGAGWWEILSSPLTNPTVFWPRVANSDSMYFILALAIPMGAAALWHGRWVLLAVVPPLGVLLIWNHAAATSINFQYSTTLIPTLVVAALTGAFYAGGKGGTSVRAMRSHGMAALAAALTASTFVGALPWSRPTIPFAPQYDHTRIRLREMKVIRDNALAVGRSDSVVATGRIAAHLLHIRNVDLVWRVYFQARKDGVDESQMYLDRFDTIIVDFNESFEQSVHDSTGLLRIAENRGFVPIFAARGVVVYRRMNRRAPAPTHDPLREWRVSAADIEEIEAGGQWHDATPGIQAHVKPLDRIKTDAGDHLLFFRMIWRTTEERLPRFRFRHYISDKTGTAVGDSGIRKLVGGNRPTSLCRKGESYQERYGIILPPGTDLAGLTHEIQIVKIEEEVKLGTGYIDELEWRAQDGAPQRLHPLEDGDDAD